MNDRGEIDCDYFRIQLDQTIKKADDPVGGVAPNGVPMTLKDVDLPGRIRQAGGTTLKEAGEFFGWKPRWVTKTAVDFTKNQLLAKGWTKERLIDVAEGYEQIARISPQNPSAAGRAAQLREIAKLFD